MNYSKKIIEYRKKELITQAELAKKLKVGVASVSRWEQGHFEPTIKTKRKIRLLLRKAGIEEE